MHKEEEKGFWSDIIDFVVRGGFIAGWMYLLVIVVEYFKL